jgi:hypothetical protein
VPALAGGILFEGGSGTNTLLGPGRDTTWHVIGAGAGDVSSPSFFRFTGIENLDYDQDTIDAGSNWVVVTEDTVSRRGIPVGGLTPRQDYYIIKVRDDRTTPQDESNGNSKVRLAETRQKAIDGGAWEAAGGHAGQRNPFAVDLKAGGGDLDRVTFTSADVNATANSITIKPGLGPFEFGQKVIYREDGIDLGQLFGTDDQGREYLRRCRREADARRQRQPDPVHAADSGPGSQHGLLGAVEPEPVRLAGRQSLCGQASHLPTRGKRAREYKLLDIC